ARAVAGGHDGRPQAAVVFCAWDWTLAHSAALDRFSVRPIVIRMTGFLRCVVFFPHLATVKGRSCHEAPHYRARRPVCARGGVRGSDVVTQDFSTTVAVTSSANGQCNIVTLDLGPIDVNALVATVDVPAATVTAKGSGALGSLLCNLGQALNPVTGAVRGLVQ